MARLLKYGSHTELFAPLQHSMTSCSEKLVTGTIKSPFKNTAPSAAAVAEKAQHALH